MLHLQEWNWSNAVLKNVVVYKSVKFIESDSHVTKTSAVSDKY